MTDRRIDWYRTRLEPEVLRELTRKSNARGLLRILGFLLIYCCTAAIAVWLYLHRLWVPMVIACYVHSMFATFLSSAAAVHELSHGTVLTNRKVSEAFYRIFCFLSWSNPIHFRVSHGYHHQFTVHRGIDLEVMQGPVGQKLNAKNLVFWFTFNVPVFLRWMQVTFLHAIGIDEMDYFFWSPLLERDDPRRKPMIRFARLLLVGHLLLAGVFALTHLWVLIYLVTFSVFFANFLAAFCAAMQHTGLPENTPDWRVTCHTVECGPIIRFLYWNMNFHIEHHMFAAVPFYNLPRLHRLVAADFPVPQRSFLAALRLLADIRRRQKSDPAYVYLPEFPSTASPVRWEERSR